MQGAGTWCNRTCTAVLHRLNSGQLQVSGSKKSSSGTGDQLGQSTQPGPVNCPQTNSFTVSTSRQDSAHKRTRIHQYSFAHSNMQDAVQVLCGGTVQLTEQLESCVLVAIRADRHVCTPIKQKQTPSIPTRTLYMLLAIYCDTHDQQCNSVDSWEHAEC